MNLKSRMDKFNKRWGITSTDSYEDSFRKFKTRILNIFDEIDRHLTEESVTEFCQYLGIKEVWHRGIVDNVWSTNVWDRLTQENDEKEFYRLIELIFSLDITETIGYDRSYTYSKDILFSSVTEAVELSDVNVSITESDGAVILYPKGEKLLDIELVDLPLSFLNKESGEHYIQALQFFSTKKYIKSAESLRRALEEFLKFKLGNTKGLNSNIGELQIRLKSDKRDVQVRDIIGATLSHLDQYFNENSKHNDGVINEAENEFLVYQAGVLMRYIESSV